MEHGYEMEQEEAEGEPEYSDLDLEKILTWTANAVIIQAGGEFRLPLIVPHPSVLAIQFEVDGGYDIEFSLQFKDDLKEDFEVLVEPARFSDKEGELDIDTTGVCELVWSNAHAWVTSKTLSYQLQLAPKLDLKKRKWITAILTAAQDYRLLSAAEASEQVDQSIRTLHQRVASLEEELTSKQEKEKEAQVIYDRYTGHVKRLEEEVAAAKRHVEQAASDLSAKQRETTQTQRTLTALKQINTLDDGITPDISELLQEVSEPLNLIYEAYAGTLYNDEEHGSQDTPLALDRAELIHFLQESQILGRGDPPEVMCGIFNGVPQQLSPEDYKRCIARSALALAPIEETGNKLLWFLAMIVENTEKIRMPSLTIQRRVKVLTACDMIAEIIYEQEPEESQGS